MLLPLTLLPGFLLADITVPPGPHRRVDAIRTLAEAHAVVLVATNRCPDMFATEEVTGLQVALGLTNDDTAEAYSVLLDLARGMNAEVDKVGEKSWCDGIYGQFGPDGTKMKRLLKRCDPRATSC